MKNAAKIKKGMQSYKNEFIKGPAAIVNWTRINELSGLPPEEFQAVDLVKEIPVIGSDKYEELSKLQRSARLAGAKGDKKAFRIQTFNQQARQAIRGIPSLSTVGKKPDKNAVKRENQYYREFAKELELIPEKERNHDRVAELINQLLAPTDYDSSFLWGTPIT